MFRVKNTQSPGQIFIEALMGLAIVSVALIVLVSLSLRALRIQQLNKQWQQSSLLEQEALEAVRQIRDGYGLIRYVDPITTLTVQEPWSWTNSKIWDSPDETYFRLYYDHLYVDPQTGEDAPQWVMEKLTATSPTDLSYRLHWNSETHEYGYPARGGFLEEGSVPMFFRQLVVTDTPDTPKSRAVSCIMSWEDRKITHQTKLVTLFSQW